MSEVLIRLFCLIWGFGCGFVLAIFLLTKLGKEAAKEFSQEILLRHGFKIQEDGKK